MEQELDLKNIFVRRAKKDEDIDKALYVRWEGYKKYFKSMEEMIGDQKVLPNETLLLAVDEHDNPVGTMRILDRRFGPIDLDKFFNVDNLLKGELPCAEASRLVVPNHPKKFLIKIALWKAYFLYCFTNHIETMLFTTRPIFEKAYSILLFEDIGERGVYYNNELAGKKHKTYKLSVKGTKTLWETAGNSLSHFMFYETHTNIEFK